MRYTIFCLLTILFTGCQSMTINPHQSDAGLKHSYAIYNKANDLIYSPIPRLELGLSFAKKTGKPISDIYVISHGWNFTHAESFTLWQAYLETITRRFQQIQSVDRAFNPYVIFVVWDSASRPLTNWLNSMYPFDLPGVVELPAAVGDTLFQVATGWGETQNASEIAIGRLITEERKLRASAKSVDLQDYFGLQGERSKYLSLLTTREQVQDGIFNSYSEAFGIDEPGMHGPRISLSAILDYLIRRRFHESYKLHTVGHSYGAKLISLASFDACERLVKAQEYGIAVKGITTKECSAPSGTTLEPSICKGCDLSNGVVESEEHRECHLEGRATNHPYIDSMILFNAAMRATELYPNNDYVPVSLSASTNETKIENANTDANANEPVQRGLVQRVQSLAGPVKQGLSKSIQTTKDVVFESRRKGNLFAETAAKIGTKMFVSSRHDSANGILFSLSQILINNQAAANNNRYFDPQLEKPDPSGIGQWFAQVPRYWCRTVYADWFPGVLFSSVDFCNTIVDTALTNLSYLDFRQTYRRLKKESNPELFPTVRRTVFFPAYFMRAIGNEGLTQNTLRVSAFDSAFWYNKETEDYLWENLVRVPVATSDPETYDPSDQFFNEFYKTRRERKTLGEDAFYSVDATDVYDGKQNWVPWWIPPGAHGDLRSETDMIGDKNKMEWTIDFIFKATAEEVATAASAL